jgi:hypothetical protein
MPNFPGNNNNLLLSFVVSQGFGGFTPGGYWTQPSGWTEFLYHNSPISSIAFRIKQPEDTSGTWTTTAGSQFTRLLVAAFANAVVHQIGVKGTDVSNNATVTCPGITTTVNNTMLLAVIITSESSAPPVTPAGFSLIASAGGTPAIFVFARNQPDAGPTGNVTTNFTTFQGGHYGFLISIFNPLN